MCCIFVLLEETAGSYTESRRPGHETTAVTDREYRSQCIRGHIACLETRFVSFPRPPTTNVHCDPLNNFNMAAASTGARTRPVPIYRRLSHPTIPHYSLHDVYTILLHSVYVMYHGLKKTYVEASLKESTIKRYVRITLIEKAKSTFAHSIPHNNQEQLWSSP